MTAIMKWLKTNQTETEKNLDSDSPRTFSLVLIRMRMPPLCHIYLFVVQVHSMTTFIHQLGTSSSTRSAVIRIYKINIRIMFFLFTLLAVLSIPTVPVHLPVSPRYYMY